MTVTRTPIENLLIIEPNVFQDERGYFMESFKSSFIEEFLPNINFIQDNESKSTYGVLRGIHFQKPPFAQTKLVRVIDGEVLDVAVDLRAKSPTYGKHFSIVLTGENKKQLFIPRGFGHCFVVLSKTAIFSYKVDNHYNPESDSGILYNDKLLSIDWKLMSDEIIISTKDKSLQNMMEFKSPFNYNCILIKLSKRHIAKTISWRLIGTLDTIAISYFVTGSLITGLSIGASELISKMVLYYLHERLWFNSAIKNTNKRHLLKTLSWRAIGTFDTVLISFFLTGNGSYGLQIGGIETVTKMILYYFHEKLWYRINFGLDRINKNKLNGS